ncbi:degenerate transposase [Streptococcus pneumoniae]|nr:degenerate transposase [Streptococcus pneumoniae]VPR35198.1 degenerate transposase [Streptococcus pneumoniae]VPV37226.1 degenerate transposase [Streptococcus pneumoniae]VRI00811.1 degenerate transposase [Streptococcus pneumoniae]VRK89979.1 degenerate transposase [Streptococcus pneumoniae]
MWDTRRRVLEIKSLKQGVIQDKGVNMMRTVFRMDVSKASSEVAILVNGEKVHGYTMPNDAIGFSRLSRGFEIGKYT